MPGCSAVLLPPSRAGARGQEMGRGSLPCGHSVQRMWVCVPSSANGAFLGPRGRQPSPPAWGPTPDPRHPSHEDPAWGLVSAARGARAPHRAVTGALLCTDTPALLCASPRAVERRGRVGSKPVVPRDPPMAVLGIQCTVTARVT